MDVRVAVSRGREACARREWAHGFRTLAKADREESLAPQDLELLATAAYMLGRDDDHLEHLKRAHRGHLDAGDPRLASRCAFWAGINLAMRGQSTHAAGWFGRARRAVERHAGDCVEQGYLLVPTLLERVGSEDWKGVAAVAEKAADIAERFRDADLFALAAHERGHALARLGHVEEGLGLIDEVMVAVTAGELSPVVTGLVYCSVIAYCQDLFQLHRSQAWTHALAQWCNEQPEMMAHTGQCRVHRAQVLQVSGAWGEAIEEARRARSRFEASANRAAAGRALYQEAEIYRLQGKFGLAEKAYRDASRCGCEPQPGLALLRLDQGKTAVAAAAIRRALAETADVLKRAKLLPTYVEVMLAAGNVEEARNACRELEDAAKRQASGVLDALVAHARGRVELAGGDLQAGLTALRRAFQAWHGLEAPYEAARLRVLVADACRRLGDNDTAVLELEAARSVFAQLGAAPDLARADALTRSLTRTPGHGLTARELEVLRRVAAGKRNKSIAAELTLSERTVDRHVSNIFDKLGVSSRAAATAYAYRNQLV